MAVGMLASVKGFRAAFPLAAGLDAGGRLVAAALLVFIGCRVSRLRNPAEASITPASLHAEFTAGVMTAVTNPLTTFFFAAQFLGLFGDLGQG